MTSNNLSEKKKLPSVFYRLWSVWNRHEKVYAKNIFSNAIQPVLEPVIFLLGIGFGLGAFIQQMDGMPYIQFLSTGLLISTAMMTSAFECSYGTFIRMEFDQVYDGMVAAPLKAENLLLGEILWAGTKGLFFSLVVLLIVFVFGIIKSPMVFFVPLIGFLTGLMFASLSMFITSFVKSIDSFSFYFSGLLSPMLFLSGVVFPVSNLPKVIQPVAEMMPLTHPVRIARAICFNRWDMTIVYDFTYIFLFILIAGFLGISRLKKRIID